MRPEAIHSVLRVAPERPLRVLMILESDFTQKGGGGAESQLRTIALHLKRLKQQVTVMTPLNQYGPQITAERCYGIPVGRLRYPHWKVIGAAVMCVRFGGFLWRNKDRYDAWHVHIGHNLGAVTCLLGSILGKPVVLKISGWWELEEGHLGPRAGLLGVIARSWLKKASTVQAISTRIAGELERRGFPVERVLVLPNAVNTKRFTARTAPLKKPFVAVFVGRLVPEKGLATLFDAWASAFAGRQDVKLRLVGGGAMEMPLREQAEKLGISHQVEFLGHQDRVEDILAAAHVGVLCSRIEGLSNTLLEFMACGLPVVASRVSGSEDFVQPGRNGWLFDVSDVAALADCLREAESLSPERLAELGKKARQEVESKAALDNVVGRLMQLYRGQS